METHDFRQRHSVNIHRNDKGSNFAALYSFLRLPPHTEKLIDYIFEVNNSTLYTNSADLKKMSAATGINVDNLKIHIKAIKHSGLLTRRAQGIYELLDSLYNEVHVVSVIGVYVDFDYISVGKVTFASLGRNYELNLRIND